MTNLIPFLILVFTLLTTHHAADRLMERQDNGPPPKFKSVVSLPYDYERRTFKSQYERSLGDPKYDGYHVLRGYKIERITNYLIRTEDSEWTDQALYYLTCKLYGRLTIEVRGIADIAVRDGFRSIVLRVEDK
jgi:hypothetical protein